MTEVVLRVRDPRRRLRAVRLATEIEKRAAPREFHRNGTRVWELALPRPPVDRMEYLLELEYADGRTELVPDPDNPRRAPGAFGERSVLEFEGYAAPGWVEDEDAPPGNVERLELRARGLGAPMQAHVWTSEGTAPEEPLPLLVVHDGPEYAEYSCLLRFLDHFHSFGDLPPLRAALLEPVNRDQHYSASAVYARALAEDVMAALDSFAPTTVRVGMGASLGALAMLHAHRTFPAAFSALFLQSGSYFQPRLDAQEREFVRFRRITRFVSMVTSRRDVPHPIAVTITCGTGEENLANNRALAAALDRQGYEVRLVENRDAHTWVGWRDTFDPHLLRLLQTVA